MQPIVWTKQGRFLTPENAPAWRRGQCGMTSILPWNDGYRLFLTGRDEKNRYQIGHLDLDPDLRVVDEPAHNPILSAGELGCFDMNGACMPSVVRVSDSVLHLYYVGWGPWEKTLFTNRCGLLISRDNGTTWNRWSRAPLPMIDDVDPIGVGTVFVLREQGGFRMWYTTFTAWRTDTKDGLRHYYHIKYADSEDGIHWQKPADNTAIDYVDDNEYAIGRPCVVKESDGYRMWFCRRSEGSTYRIGYAESPDGKKWARCHEGVTPSAEGWDSEMVEYAYVIRQKPGQYLMIYNGNGFGESGTGSARGIIAEPSTSPPEFR